MRKNEIKSFKKERRMGERLSYKQLIKYKVMESPEKSSDEFFLKGKLLNLSNEGMKISTTKLIEKGVILKVLFPFLRGKVNVPSLAEVRWVKKKGKGTYYAGLSFLV